MARRLNATQNELKIHDNVSDSTIVMYYRQPTASEIAEYQNKQIERKRNKVTFRQGEIRIEYGNKVLTGFRDGDFEIPREDGGYLAIASDPKSPDYNEEWRKHVNKYAPDLVSLLGAYVFEGSAEITDAVDLDKD